MSDQDIDEVEVLRRKLAASEERFNLLLSAMPDGFVIHEGGIIRYTTEKTERYVGYEPGELIGKSVFALVAEEDRALARERVAGGEDQDYELVGRRKDGTRFPALVRTKNAVIEGHQCRMLILRDLTAQRRLEEAQRRSEERFRRIIEGAPDAIAVHSKDRFIYVNPAAITMWGCQEPDELIGRSALGVIHPEDRALATWRIREQVEKGQPVPTIEERIVRRDGSVMWGEVTAMPIEYDERSAIVTFVRDITARRLAEAERDRLLVEEQAARAVAERAERRAAFLAEASRVLASSLDYEATLTSVAQIAVSALGTWCVVDLVGDRRVVYRVAAAHRDKDKEAMLHSLVQPQPAATSGIIADLVAGRSVLVPVVEPATLQEISLGSDEIAAALHAADANIRPRSIILVPLTVRGRTIGVITIAACDDVRFGQDDLRLVEDLAQRSAIAVDNARLYREAREAVLAREEFLSIASHELKTPLTSLQLAIQSVERLLRPAVTAESVAGADLFVRQAIETAGRQTRRLIQLVHALLDVSRIHTGQLVLSLEGMDLSALVREASDRLRADLESARCAIELDLEPAWGRWDRSRIDQVVTNLLSNAIKFGARKPISVTVRKLEGVVRLTVQDRGIGLAESERDRIFRRFERAVSQRHYGGLGLGLYIVHRIVKAHGGKVYVDSQPGQGAIFSVELPPAGPPCESIAESTSADPSAMLR